MNKQLWKRLEAAEHSDGQMAVFMPKAGESEAEAEVRFERWKAGKSMEGLPDYADVDGSRIIRVQFVERPKC